LNTVQTYTTVVATSATGTATIYVGNSEQIILHIPAINTTFGSTVIAFSLLGAPTSTQVPVQMYYWDYGSTTPKSCVVTAGTAGCYELPNAGGAPYVRISFDVAATKTTGITMMTPKTTY
jgi:hypothetical protein